MASARRSGLQASQASPAKLLDDSRFRALLSNDDWGRLPVATWRRFSTRRADGGTIVYVGEVDDAGVSRIGWWLVQLARLIGGPLPTGAETGVPMIVTVTEDEASGAPEVIQLTTVGLVAFATCPRSVPSGLYQRTVSGRRLTGRLATGDTWNRKWANACFEPAGRRFTLRNAVFDPFRHAVRTTPSAGEGRSTVRI